MLNLLTAVDLLLVALMTLKGLLTAASKKQMYGAALSGWKPSCSQALGISCFSCLRGFFLCKYQSMSLVCKWVRLGELHGLGALGHSLWPWGQAGASCCQCWQHFVFQTQPVWPSLIPLKHPSDAHCKAANAQVIDLKDIPSFLLPVLC